MRLDGTQVYVRPFAPKDAPRLLDLHVRNRAFTTPYYPTRPDEVFTLDVQRLEIERLEESWRAGIRFGFGIFASTNDGLVGTISLSNVVRGSWQNATVGYFVDQKHNGRGIATEALTLVLRFAFEHAGLHRVQGAAMPWNAASNRVLVKVGMRFEGMSPRYLQINGKWEDHNVYAMTAEEWHAGTHPHDDRDR